jgi:hypothetical protein
VELWLLIICALGHVASQLTAHLLLYKQPLPFTARYAVGSSLFGIWFTFGALYAGTWLTAYLAVALFWVILLPAGAAIVVAYWLRGVFTSVDQRAFAAGLAAGEQEIANEPANGATVRGTGNSA